MVTRTEDSNPMSKLPFMKVLRVFLRLIVQEILGFPRVTLSKILSVCYSLLLLMLFLTALIIVAILAGIAAIGLWSYLFPDLVSRIMCHLMRTGDSILVVALFVGLLHIVVYVVAHVIIVTSIFPCVQDNWHRAKKITEEQATDA